MHTNWYYQFVCRHRIPVYDWRMAIDIMNSYARFRYLHTNWNLHTNWWYQYLHANWCVRIDIINTCIRIGAYELISSKSAYELISSKSAYELISSKSAVFLVVVNFGGQDVFLVNFPQRLSWTGPVVAYILANFIAVAELLPIRVCALEQKFISCVCIVVHSWAHGFVCIASPQVVGVSPGTSSHFVCVHCCTFSHV